MNKIIIILLLTLTSCFSEQENYDYTEYVYKIKYDDNTIDTIIVNDPLRTTDMYKCFRNDYRIICDVKELECIKTTVIYKLNE